MQSEIEGRRGNRKKTVGKAAAIFLAVMVLLTFFSNTLNNFTSPAVTCENPVSGGLVRSVKGSGVVQAKKILDQYVHSEMPVLEVQAKAGEQVKKGQVIMTLDTSKVEESVKNEKDLLQQKQISLQKLKQQGSDAILASYETSSEAARMKMEKTKRDYESNKELFQAGAVSENDLRNSEMDYENARNAYEEEKNKKSKELGSNSLDVKNAELEVEMQARKVQDAEKDLALKQVTAPQDGTIMEINFSKGTTVDSTKPLYRLADTTQGFEFLATVDVSSAKYLLPGDQGTISIDSANGQSVQGTILQIADNQGDRGKKKDVLFEMEADGLIGGESGSMEVEKGTKTYDMLVSNAAVGKDIGGYFVYIVREKQGPLGNQHYAQKVKVTVGDADDMKTAVISGISPNDRVIVRSSKQLSDGAKVTINQ